MSRLRPVKESELNDAQRELWDGLTASRGGGVGLQDADGALIGPFNAWVHEPKIGRRLSSLGAHLRFKTSLERRLSEVAICTVGAHWKAEFEFFAHAPMAIDAGVDPAIIDSLRAGESPTFGKDDERIVHAVTEQLLQNRRCDDATYAAAEALLGETGMVELAALVGYYCLISMILNLFEVPLPPDEPLNWPDE